MAGGIDWFRWHHGSVTDPKFQLIAKKAGVRLGDVMVVWAFLLENASGNAERGVIGALDFETLDFLLGMEDGTAARIYDTMTQRGLIDAGGRIARWDARQPKRERDPGPTEPGTPAPKSSTERSREHRSRTASSAPDKVTQRDATPRNANSSQETPRVEESREDTSSLRSDESMSGGAAKGYPADFELAWKAYPSRPGNNKSAAFKAWCARIKAGATADALIAGVQRYAVYVVAEKTAEQYIKHAATFFGPDEHYLSDWTPPQARASPPASKHSGFESKNYREGIAEDGSFT